MKNYIKKYFIDNNKRDLIIILPGGGYQRTSPREGIPVSNFLNKNEFHTAIYYYREELLKLDELIKEANDLLKPISLDYRVNNIYLLGFSAGGHLAGILSAKLNDLNIEGTALIYPVVSSSSNVIHKGSFNMLKRNEEDDISQYDLLNYVSPNFPKTFLFHTGSDQSVSVLNSIYLYQKLLENKVPTELHIYNDGRHGMSLGTKEVSFDDYDPIKFEHDYRHQSNWTNLLIKWLKLKEE